MRRRGCARAFGCRARLGRGWWAFSWSVKITVPLVPDSTIWCGYRWVPVNAAMRPLMSVQAFRSTGVEVQETAVRLGGATTMDRTRTPKGAWLIVALLFSFMLINFADKTVIGIAAVPIMQEL